MPAAAWAPLAGLGLCVLRPPLLVPALKLWNFLRLWQEVDEQGNIVWRSQAQYAVPGHDHVAPRVYPDGDVKLRKALASSLPMVKDGAKVVLQRLTVLRLATGIPVQAIIVVKDIRIGNALVPWLRNQELVGSLTGSPRVDMTSSKLRCDATPPANQFA